MVNVKPPKGIVLRLIEAVYALVIATLALFLDSNTRRLNIQL